MAALCKLNDGIKRKLLYFSTSNFPLTTKKTTLFLENLQKVMYLINMRKGKYHILKHKTNALFCIH